jgi:hypothetical protein
MSLQEGTLEILGEMPPGVLGYARKYNDEKIVILLNFDYRKKKIELDFSDFIFGISAKIGPNKKAVQLDGLSGAILKHIN